MARANYRSIYADLTQVRDDTALKDSGSNIGTDELWELLMAVSDWIDRYCNRHFYPLTETRYFDLDKEVQTLELNGDLIAVTTLKDDKNQDGTFEDTWASDDYHLLPHNAAPTSHWGRPYTHIANTELSGSTNNYSGFPPGQKVIELAGKWGYREHKEDSGSDINEGAQFSSSDTTLTVDDGTDFRVGQTILIESEQLLITAISTNDLTVVRGINGTTAAAHDDNTDVYILRWPPAIERACLIQASRIYTRASDFQPAFVDAELDTDVRMLLAPYRRLTV